MDLNLYDTNRRTASEDDFSAAIDKLVAKLDEAERTDSPFRDVGDRGAVQFRAALDELAKATSGAKSKPASTDGDGKKTVGKADDDRGRALGDAIGEHIARVLDRKLPGFGAARQGWDLARSGWLGSGMQRQTRRLRAAVMRSRPGRWVRGMFRGAAGGRATGRAAAMTRLGQAASGAGARAGATAAAGGSGAGAAAGGGSAAAGAGGAGAAAGGAAAVPVVGWVVAALMACEVAIRKFKKATEETTDRLLEDNRRRADFSAAAAQVEAIRGAREAYREKGLGDRSAPSANFLMQSEQFKKDQQVEYKAFMAKAESYLAGIANYAEAMDSFLKNKLWRQVNKLIEGDKGGEVPTMFEIGKEAAAAAQVENEREENRLRELRQQIKAKNGLR